MKADARGIFSASNSMRQFFAYVFITSKKANPEFKNLTQEMAIPILNSERYAVLLFSNTFFKPGKVAHELSQYLEKSTKPLTKDDWNSIVFHT